MPNPRVPAAAEGMPEISRRTFLHLTVGSAGLGGIAIMATPSAAGSIGGTCVMHAPSSVSPGFLDLIAEHKDATREWLECLSAESAIEEDRIAIVAALNAEGASKSQIDAAREAHKADPEALAGDDAVGKASEREAAALDAIFAFPTATLADLRGKLEHLLAMPDRDESFGMVDHPTTMLMQSIMGGGLV